MDSIPGSGRSPGVGPGNPLQYCHLENPTDRGAWWATVHGVLKDSNTTAQCYVHALSMHISMHTHGTTSWGYSPEDILEY